MFGRNKNLKKDEFEEESDISPEDILEDDLPQVEETIEENEIEEKEEKIEEKPESESSVEEINKGVEEEQDLEVLNANLAHQQTKTIMEHEQIINMIMQNYQVMDERIKSLESSIFRIRNS